MYANTKMDRLEEQNLKLRKELERVAFVPTGAMQHPAKPGGRYCRYCMYSDERIAKDGHGAGCLLAAV